MPAEPRRQFQIRVTSETLEDLKALAERFREYPSQLARRFVEDGIRRNRRFLPTTTPTDRSR